eukprot:3387768-Prymnesium_polylepis.1
MRRLYSTAILFGDGAFDHSCLCHQHERLQLLPRRNGCGDRVHRIRLDWARPELQRSVASLSCVISLELVRAEEDHGRLEGSECVCAHIARQRGRVSAAQAWIERLLLCAELSLGCGAGAVRRLSGGVAHPCCPRSAASSTKNSRT